eukprot:522285-Pleurochrysis_carterae.AAC.2
MTQVATCGEIIQPLLDAVPATHTDLAAEPKQATTHAFIHVLGLSSYLQSSFTPRVLIHVSRLHLCPDSCCKSACSSSCSQSCAALAASPADAAHACSILGSSASSETKLSIRWRSCEGRARCDLSGRDWTSLCEREHARVRALVCILMTVLKSGRRCECGKGERATHKSLGLQECLSMGKGMRHRRIEKRFLKSSVRNLRYLRTGCAGLRETTSDLRKLSGRCPKAREVTHARLTRADLTMYVEQSRPRAARTRQSS